MTWKEAKKLFDIHVESNEYEHPYMTRELVVEIKKFGWKSRFAYALDMEGQFVGIHTLILPASKAIQKLEAYLGEEIIFEHGDTIKNIINEQKNESVK
jgi:hypothetical protein